MLCRGDEGAFFTVLFNSDLWKEFRKHMFLRKNRLFKVTKLSTSNFYDYKNGDSAAYHNYFDIIKYHKSMIFTSSAINYAIINGHLEVVQYLHQHIHKLANYGTNRITKEIAYQGNTIGLARLMEHHDKKNNIQRIDYHTTQRNSRIQNLLITIYRDQNDLVHDVDIINTTTLACINGYLDVVKWLSIHRPQSFTERAIDGAILGGHLVIVKFLCQNMVYTCSEDAMEDAIRSGNLDLVKFLHYEMGTVTSLAATIAAERGYLEIVKWLYEEDITHNFEHTIDKAAASGHLDVVIFLYNNVTKSYTEDLIDSVVSNGHYDITKFLIDKDVEKCTWYGLQQACYKKHDNIITLLFENNKVDLSRETLRDIYVDNKRFFIKFLYEHKIKSKITLLEEAQHYNAQQCIDFIETLDD